MTTKIGHDSNEERITKENSLPLPVLRTGNAPGLAKSGPIFIPPAGRQGELRDA